MVDLWPAEIGASNLRTPVSILREQASLLGVKTNNVVEGAVGELNTPVAWGGKHDFAYAFYIVAPLLKNYRYRLFAIAHTLEMYPLTMKLNDDIKEEISEVVGQELNRGPFSSLIIDAEDDLIKVLGLVFKSSRTLRVIQSLIAQSKT